MTEQFEVLETITMYNNTRTIYLSYTNTNGIIFFLDSLGKVNCLDPCGEKQLTEVHDLQ